MPVLSIVLSQTEKLWGRLARDVYAERCQFETVQDLKPYFERNWFSLNSEFLRTLAMTIPNPVFNLIKTKEVKFWLFVEKSALWTFGTIKFKF